MKRKLISLSAVVAAIAIFGENLSQIWANQVWLVGYVVLDFFALEILALILIYVFFRFLQRWLRERWDYYTSLWRSGAYLAASITSVALTILIALSLVQFRYYARGKKVQYNFYSLELVQRSSDAFVEGNVKLALLHLHVGERVFDFNKCRDAREFLEARSEAIEQGYRALELAGDSPYIRKRILIGLRQVSAEQPYFTNLYDELLVMQDLALTRYSQALDELIAGESEAAASTLASIERDVGTVWNVESTCSKLDGILLRRELGVDWRDEALSSLKLWSDY